MIGAKVAVLCVPSRYDGWGLVVPEGLASGLPTIATGRTGAALDLITTGANGWVVEANQALADEPATINADPMGRGWFMKLKLANKSELDGLMDEAGYKKFVEGLH